MTNFLNQIKNRRWFDVEADREGILEKVQKTVPPKASIHIRPVDETYIQSPLGHARRPNQFYAPQTTEPQTFPITASEKEEKPDVPDFTELIALARTPPGRPPKTPTRLRPQLWGRAERFPLEPKEFRLRSFFHPTDPEKLFQLTDKDYEDVKKEIDSALESAGTKKEIVEAFGDKYVDAIIEAVVYDKIGGETFTPEEVTNYFVAWGLDYEKLAKQLGEAKMRTRETVQQKPITELADPGTPEKLIPASLSAVDSQLNNITVPAEALGEKISELANELRGRRGQDPKQTKFIMQERINKIVDEFATEMADMEKIYREAERTFERMEDSPQKQEILRRMLNAKSAIEGNKRFYEILMSLWGEEGGEGATGPVSAR